MLSYNLESQFVGYLNDIERLKVAGDYENLIIVIKKAKECAKRLYDEATDKNRKDIMYNNAVKLDTLEKKCIQKLQEQGKSVPVEAQKTNVSKAPARPNAPSSRPSTAKQSTNVKEENKPQADISYQIGEVDVKQFLVEDSNEVITFEDVKGMQKEKVLISQEFFLDEKTIEFNKVIGKKPKRFILLYGLPGTGKTFFAKAISYELKNNVGADVPFFSVVGANLKDSKVGGTEKNIHALFEFCKQFERCVLFIDEFETLVPSRLIDTGDPTAKSTVTTFLQEMDGFSSATGTLLIGATNYPYTIDSAVLSRGGVRIEIPLPNEEIVIGVLQAKLGDRHSADLDYNECAKLLVSKMYSNRDIKNIIDAMQTALSEKFNNDVVAGKEVNIADYVYTKEMFLDAVKLNPSVTNPDELRRIKEFRENGR